MGDYSGRFDTLYWSPAEVRDLASNLSTWGKDFEDNIKEMTYGQVIGIIN